MSSPTVLLQLSDPHLVAGDDEREAAFAKAIARAVALDVAFDAVLVTGDIAHHGAAEEYSAAARLLSAFDVPVYVIPGNMDDRRALRVAFPAIGGEGDEPVQYALDIGGLRVVLTDSTVPGEVPGQLDVGWIAGQLDEGPGHPTVLVFHHPPHRIGVAGLDALGLPEGDRRELATLLERSPQVVRVLCGHVHRPTTGLFGGRVVTTAPSVAYPFQLTFGDAVPPSPTSEPRGFALHVWDGEALVTHVVAI